MPPGNLDTGGRRSRRRSTALMRFIDPNTAHRNNHAHGRAKRSRQQTPNGRSRFIAAMLVTAVAVVLLSSSGARAGLVSDLPKSHWSYMTLRRLQEAGIIDHSAYSSFRSDKPQSRYELAQRVQEAVGLARFFMTGESGPTMNPLTSVKARFVAARLHVRRADALSTALTGLSLHSESAYTRATAERSFSRFSREVKDFAAQLRSIESDAAAFFAMAGQPVATVVDEARLDVLDRRLKHLLGTTLSSVERVLSPITSEDALALSRVVTPTRSEGLELWLSTWRGRQSASPLAPARQGATLAEDLRALESEFAPELELLYGGGDPEPIGWYDLQMSHFDHERSAISTLSSETRSGHSQSEDVTVDKLSRFVQREDDGAGGHEPATPTPGSTPRDQSNHARQAGSGLITSVGLDPFASGFPSWSEGRTGGSGGHWGLSAGYGLGIMGVELLTDVTLRDVQRTRKPAATTRVGASVPVFDNKGELEAAYVVDIERLRELTDAGEPGGRTETVSGEVGGGLVGGTPATVGTASKGRIAFSGSVPLGNAVSIKVGYEIPQREWKDEDGLGLGGGLMEAGLEYTLGERGSVQAGYHWGAEGDGHRSRADVGVGYRLGENTSLTASYSMVRFDAGAEEDYRSDLGEAELTVTF